MNLEKNDPQKLALVTGAGWRIGKLIALHLARQGYAIGVHYHTSESRARETVNEVREIGVDAYLLQADLADPIEIQNMFALIDRMPHPVGVVVNSAAFMKRSNLLSMEIDEWELIMNLNARAVWLVSREASKRMGSGGLIVNISDVGARKNWTGYGAYAVSKAAVESITRILARQLAPAIRVNAIAPGLLMSGDDISTEGWEMLVEKVPMKKSGDLDQFLDTLDFLLSNGYITGEVINFAGGYQLV